MSDTAVVNLNHQIRSVENNSHGPIDGPVFREWTPLHHLIEKIPPRFHQGFVSKDLILTCVGVSCDSVVLGSNAGVLFWFSRNNQSVVRKTVDDKFIPNTALALTVCHYGEVLAVGNSQGTVALFLANSAHYTPITAIHGEECHKSPVTALSWDGGGDYLLSGDEEGKVFLFKFNHSSLHPIREVLHEPSSIVQLRFHPLEKNVVLVSSMKRALVADISTEDTDSNQVGQQDRKYPAPFGADFGYAGNETVIYSSRAGLRLWLSDCRGAVQQTLIFKESLTRPRTKLILLSVREEYSSGEAHFGPVYCLSNGLVLTFSPSSLFILDTGQMGEKSGDQVSVFCSSRFQPKTLRHATVFHNEIFILLENRVLIRVSDRPDQSLTVPSSSSVTMDRPLLSGWRDKLPVKPTFQSTISKLAHKISDVEIKPLAAPVTTTGPYIIESLSNALAPLFEMKTLPINRCAPPKPIQPQFSSRTRTPSPTVLVGERYSSPSSLDRTLNNSHSECTTNVERGSPFSNDSSRQGSPVVVEERAPLCPRDEELVYGSYIGRKRKLKLNRKLSSQDEVVPLSEQSHHHNRIEDDVESWLGNSSAPVAKDDFLEELKRKDQLLAELLQLDQLSSCLADRHSATQAIVESEQVSPPEDSVNQSCLEHQTPCPVSTQKNTSPPTVADDESQLENEQKDNIYSIYASEDDGSLDKSLPHSCTSTKIPVSTPTRTVSSSSDYENISTDDLCEWIICPMDPKRKVSSVTACRHYVVVIYSQKYVYYQSTESTFEARDWLPIATPANQIAVSNSGQQLWRLYKGTAYQGVFVNPHCPVAQHWTVLDSYISSIGIVQLDVADAMEDFVWMLHANGSLSCRSVKTPKKMVIVEVPGPVSQLCCHNDLVLILLANGALYSRSRVSFETPMGVGWQRQEVPGRLVTIALSPTRHLWALNRSEQMFFRATHDKRWWQVSVLPAEFQLESPNWLNVSSFFKRQTSRFELAVTDSRVCLALIGSSVLMTAQNLFGYAWDQMTWSETRESNVDSWKIINTASFNDEEKSGIVWLVDDKNRLFCSFNDQLEQMSLPTDSPIQQLSVKGNHLWLLTTLGKIFVRVANSNPIGSGWVSLPNGQFQSSNRLSFVSLGSDLAWACDQYGHTYFRSGDNGPPTLMAPAWIAVDEVDIFFEQIHVSPNLSVWAIDKDGKVYFRQGVTSEMLIGTAWTAVEGVQAIQLAISETSVWVLSNNGSIYRRCGITQRNSSGSSWDKIPGTLSFISVTVDDKLWGLDSSGVVHQLLTSSPLKNGCTKNHDEILHLDEDWVLL